MAEIPSFAEIQSALHHAVQTSLDMDWDLIALGGHEQAIAHRIAVYLESSFPDFNTDCEYNRSKHNPKRMIIDSAEPSTGENVRLIRPDIIVHLRNSNERNILAVEMKANANEDDSSDIDKLKYLSTQAPYCYAGAAFLRIYNRFDELSEGIIRATLDWYQQPGANPTETNTLVGNASIEGVKRIYEQRMAGN